MLLADFLYLLHSQKAFWCKASGIHYTSINVINWHLYLMTEHCYNQKRLKYSCVVMLLFIHDRSKLFWYTRLRKYIIKATDPSI